MTISCEMFLERMNVSMYLIAHVLAELSQTFCPAPATIFISRHAVAVNWSRMRSCTISSR